MSIDSQVLPQFLFVWAKKVYNMNPSYEHHRENKGTMITIKKEAGHNLIT